MAKKNPPKNKRPGPSAAEILRQAMACHQSGDLENAERGYRAVLSTQPDYIGALHYLGLLEAQRERYAEALLLFDRILEINPGSVDTLITRGQVLGELGRPGEALACYECALAIDPISAKAHFNRSVVLQRLMRFAEALESYDRCLALMPEIPGAMYNRGVILQKLGLHEQALESYELALKQNPNDADALNNRGIALFDLRRFDEALASYDLSIAARPGFAEALNNRGNALRELNRLEDALASCRQALAIRPEFAEAHNNLGNVLQTLGRPEEAVASFRRAVELEPEFAEAHNNLGNVLRKQGRLEEAIAVFRRAMELMPTSVDANINLSAALHQLVPPWHMPMMNDTRRNDAYAGALAAAVGEDTDVLEIGTGSGLLAMMAARLGARSVVSCEAVPLIAATARDIVAANGLESAINIIAKMSKDLLVGTDLPRRANVLVSEILSSELLGEGVLSSIEDAKRRLLAPGARIIPASGSVVFALLGGEDVRQNMMVDEVQGFNLGGFNTIASQKRYIHRQDLDIGLLTDAAEAFEFDFARRDFFPPERKTLRVPVTAAGNCYGVAQWIRLRLDDRVTFENHPLTRTPASSWQTCFYRFSNPVPVRPGQTALVGAAHNRAAVWFFWEGLED